MSEDADQDDEIPTLGSCCICEATEGVVNIVTLNFLGPVPGRGWGCVLCNLPMDGAAAVLCNTCLSRWQAGEASIRFACSGYPSSDVRIPISELTEPFDHDPKVDHGDRLN